MSLNGAQTLTRSKLQTDSLLPKSVAEPRIARAHPCQGGEPMSTSNENAGWPALPYPDWAETCTALHLWSQIVGKYRLARTPWVNHSWHATLYVTARGFTTSLIPDGHLGIETSFDLIDHAL